MEEEYPRELEDNKRKYMTTIWIKEDMEATMYNIGEELQQQMVRNIKYKQKIEMDIEMKEFWEQLMKIPKLKGERMKVETRINIQPQKREIEQKQSKVCDL